MIGLIAQLIVPLLAFSPSAFAADETADTTAPVVSVPGNLAVVAPPGADAAAVAFDVWAEDDRDGAVTVTCDWTSGSTFPLGETFVTCAAIDAAGNQGSAAFIVTVTPAPDTTAPVVSVPGNLAAEAASGADSAAISFDASASDDVDGPLAPTCDWGSGASFPVGATLVTCVATDAAGNTGSAGFTVTVNSAPAPTEAPAPAPTNTPVPTAPPTIKSDKEDYAPGELVTLTGANWQPGEQVHITVNDDQGQTWKRDVDVTADAEGRIVDKFNLPNWFVATYSVKATGASGAVATTSFTDGNVKFTPNRVPATGSQSVAAGSVFNFDMTLEKQGGGSDPTVRLPIIVNNPSQTCGAPGAAIPTSWLNVVSPTLPTSGNGVEITSPVVYKFRVSVPVGTTAGSYTGRITLTSPIGGSQTFDLCLSVPATSPTSVTDVSGSGNYGGTATLTAKLASGATDLSGKAIAFSLNGTPVGTATTGQNGVATLSNVNLSGINAGTYPTAVAASFAGDSSYAGSNGTGPLAVVPKQVAGSFTADNKVYDGNNGATILTRSLAGVVGSDDVRLSGGLAGFSDKNVGVGKTVTGTGFALAGTAAGNYTLSASTLTTTANIAVKTLTISGAVAQSKTYDGSKAANVSFDGAFLVGVVNSDEVTTDSSGYTAEFADANAGAGKAVTVTGITLGGAHAGNYTVSQPSGLTADIAPRQLTVTPDSGQGKVYGDADPVLTYTVSSGTLVDGDGFGGALGRAAGESVGSYAITLGTLSAGNNYGLTLAPATFAIAAKSLTISGAVANSKVYDGTTDATVDFAGASLVGVESGDEVSTNSSGYSASFGDENVGTDKAVSVTGVALSGADAGNYVLAQPTGLTADITKRPVTVMAIHQTKTYGDADPALTFSVTSGSLVDGESFTGSIARVAGENVGDYAITRGTLALSANYALAFEENTLTITKRPVEVAADAQSKVYGAADPDLTYRVTGGSLVNGDQFTGALVREAGENVGTYTIRQGTLALSANYDLSFVGANLTIGTRAITVTADPQSKVYGETDPALTYEVPDGSLVAGDGFTGALSRNPGESVGEYEITRGTLSAGANYDLTFVGAMLTIDKKAASVTPNNAAKTYGDGDPGLTGELNGFLAADEVTATYSRTPGETVGAYTISATLAPSDVLGNYDVTYQTATLTITKAMLTVTADDKSRTYGAANPALTGTLEGVRGEDGITANYSTEATASNPVGSYAIVPALSDPNGKLGNYSVTATNGTLTVEKAPLTVTANDATKVYGAALPTFSVSYDGFVLGEGPSVLGGTLEFATAATAASNVGDYLVTPAGLTSANYDITFATGTLTVTPKPVTVTANNDWKIYGQDDPDFTFSVVGLVDDDSLSGVECEVAGAHDNAGIYAITCAGNTNANYAATYVPGTFTVNPKAITGSFMAEAKIYDGTTAATITDRELTGVVGDDDVSLSGGTAAFADKNVGTPKTVTGSGFVLAGADKGNYHLDASTLTTTAAITARPVTVTADAKTKVYGNGDPALTFQVTSGSLVGGEEFSGTLTRDAGENVGAYAIDVGSLTAGANYDLTFVGADLQITRRPITVMAIPQSKIYGSADPDLEFSVAGDGLAFDDQFSGGLTRDAGEDVGSYAINQGTLALSANYDLSFVGANLTITKAPLTVTADDASKVYGEDNPAFSVNYDGFVLGEEPSVLGGEVAFDTAATVASPVGPYAVTPKGLTSGNYEITFVQGTLTVTPKALSVTADDTNRVYGDDNPTFTGTLTGVVNNDGITATYDSTATATSEVGAYAIVPTLHDPNSKLGNYAVTATNGTLTVTKKALTGSFTAAAKIYDGTTAAEIATRSVTGKVGNDDVSLVGGTATFADKNVGAAKMVTATGFTLAGADTDNYSLEAGPWTVTADLIPRQITVAADAKSKTYGTADPVLTHRVTVGSLVTGESFSGALSRVPGENVGEYAIELGTLTAGDNYSLTFAEATLTITKAPLTVKTNDATKVYGAANPSFTVSYQGFVNGDDAGDLGGTLVFSTTATDTSPVGAYDVRPGGLTSPNYEIAFAKGTLKIVYSATCNAGPGGVILQPINPDGSSVFKTGSTVPAKFRICDASGNSVGTAGTVSSFKLVGTKSGTSSSIVNEDVISTTPDAAFRWDAASQQWIFNISTKNLRAGTTYTYLITLNDGTTITFRFGLK